MQFKIALVRKKLPWWAKILIKLFVSNLPIHYGFWKRIGLFEHGEMNVPDYAYKSLTGLASAANATLIRDGTQYYRALPNQDFVVLEVGCGDSLFSGMISYAMGATKTYLVDAGDYASREIVDYRRLFSYLLDKGYNLNSSIVCEFESMLGALSSSYLTNGVSSLREIPDESIDFSFSNAVIEHIRRNDCKLFASELFRVTSKSGISYHRIDLRDHLGGGLNNLRVPYGLWESNLFRNSSFYTNRYRFSEIIEIFTNAGFCCEVVAVKRWSELPIPRAKLAIPFVHYSEDDLSVMEFDLLMRPSH